MELAEHPGQAASRGGPLGVRGLQCSLCGSPAQLHLSVRCCSNLSIQHPGSQDSSLLQEIEPALWSSSGLWPSRSPCRGWDTAPPSSRGWGQPPLDCLSGRREGCAVSRLVPSQCVLRREAWCAVGKTDEKTAVEAHKESFFCFSKTLNPARETPASLPPQQLSQDPSSTA